MLKTLFGIIFFPAISLAQNVGIGVTPTKARLEVIATNASGPTMGIFGGDGAGISLQRLNPAIGFNQYNVDPSIINSYRSMVAGFGWVEYLDMVSGSFNFDMYPYVASSNQPFSSTTRRLTIRQNGNVSVNAGEANASLFVSKADINLPTALFRGSQYNSTFYDASTFRNTYISGGKNGSLVYLNDKFGGDLIIGNGSSKLGINTVPTDVLEVKQVNGRGLALIHPTSFNYWELFVAKNAMENAGDLYVYYNNTNLGNFYNMDGKYYNYSDKRVKTNIEPLATTLAGVMALRPREYEMKYTNPGHIRSMGMIAQEVKTVFPEITDHIVSDELGYPGLTDLYSINYNALGALAIKAIQEQQQKIAAAQAQIDQLRKRIAVAEKLLTPSKNTAALQ